jgi:hypothetical protein
MALIELAGSNRVAAEKAYWASETVAAASEALAQFERRGTGWQAERRQLEAALAEAKGATAEPWAQRREDAARAAADARAEHARFVAEHLGELVTALEADGAVAAQRLDVRPRS